MKRKHFCRVPSFNAYWTTFNQQTFYWASNKHSHTRQTLETADPQFQQQVVAHSQMSLLFHFIDHQPVSNCRGHILKGVKCSFYFDQPHPRPFYSNILLTFLDVCFWYMLAEKYKSQSRAPFLLTPKQSWSVLLWAPQIIQIISVIIITMTSWYFNMISLIWSVIKNQADQTIFLRAYRSPQWLCSKIATGEKNL